jgi:hypothetical protein
MTSQRRKKKRRLRGGFYTSKNGHELCSSYNFKYRDRLRKHLISSSTSVHQKKKKNRRISPSLLKTSRFLENEPAKKKTTLASPFLPQGKENFLPKTSLRKFWKNKKPSNLKTFIGNNHATEMKI